MTDLEHLASLAPRQRQVLVLVAGGHDTGDIAHELSLSPRTVETHRAALTRKLGIYGTAELTLFALRVKLIDEHGRPT